MRLRDRKSGGEAVERSAERVVGLLQQKGSQRGVAHDVGRHEPDRGKADEAERQPCAQRHVLGLRGSVSM